MCLQDSAFVLSLLSKGLGKQGVIWYYLCNIIPYKQKGNWWFSQLPWFQRTAKSTYIHLSYKQLNQFLKSTVRRNPCNIYLFFFWLMNTDTFLKIHQSFLLSSCFELSSEDRNKISYSNHRDYKRLILLTLATQTALSGDLVPQPRGELNSNPSCHASPIFSCSLNIISQKAAWVQCTRGSYCVSNSLRRCILLNCALVTLP